MKRNAVRLGAMTWIVASGCGSATGLELIPGADAHFSKGAGGLGSDAALSMSQRDVGVVGVGGGGSSGIGSGGGPGIIDASAEGDALGLTDAVARSVAVAPDGTAYVAGWFAGTLAFSGGDLTAVAPNHDAFLVKFDPRGDVIWRSRFGDELDDDIQGVALDAAGGVALTGTFNGSISFGGGTMTAVGGEDSFMAHLDEAGRYIDSKQFGDGSNQHGRAVGVTASNQIVAAGDFAGALDPSTMVKSAGGYDAYLLRFTSSGDNRVWTKSFGDASDQTATSVAVHPNGSVALVGTFRDTINFGLGDLVSAGEEDAYLAYFDASGEILFNRRFGGIANDAALGVAIDATTSEIAVTGFISGRVDFGCGPVTYQSVDAFVSVVLPDGRCSYAVAWGDAADQIGRSVTFDSKHHVVVVGTFQNSLGIVGVPVATGGGDSFVVKMGPGGAIVSTRVLGGEGDQTASGVATDAAGNIFVVGSFSQWLDFGTTHLASRAATDMFFARLPP